MTRISTPPVALTFVNISSDGRADDCKKALLENGHSVSPIPPHRLTTDPARASSGCLVLYIGNQADDSIPFDRVTKAARNFPSLVIVGENPRDGIDGLLEACDEFCRWPCPADQIEIRIRRLGTKKKKPIATATNTAANSDGPDPIQRLIGQSDGFIESVQQIYRVAPYDSPVLITGETGTGKELTARAIHYIGGRRDGPFVPVNCAALPDSIIESELFGHEAGAYTDAKSRRKGLFEQANKGTLFLDEVDSLSPEKGQVILLRAVEDQLIRPVGSDAHRRLDVRLVAATNADMDELIEQREFRQDLYYRLNILIVNLTALRDRDRDIELLSQHFLKNFTAQYGFEKRLSVRGLQSLMSYAWPGNVRELENYLHREYLQRDGDVLDCNSLVVDMGTDAPSPSLKLRLDGPFREAKASVINQFERGYLIRIIKRTKGNVSEAARIAGKERRSLGRLIKKHGIDIAEYR